MISLIDVDRSRPPPPRRSVSFDNSALERLDQNANKVATTAVDAPPRLSKTRSSLLRLFASMRYKKRSFEEPSSSSASSCADSMRTISSDTLLQDAALSSPAMNLRSPGSFSSNSSADKRLDSSEHLLRKKKYFSDRNKNILKKIIHPSYAQRNSQYRKLFGHLTAEDDLFLISFSCAYQREILCQGRMYISQRHICFHANILGWETCLAIPVEKITALSRERAALIFPNSLQIETSLGEKYFFASFVKREKSLVALQMVLDAAKNNQVVSPEQMYEKLNARHLQDKAAGTLQTPSSISTNTEEPLIRSEPPTTSSATLGEEADFAMAERVSQTSLDYQEEANCPHDTHTGKLLLDSVFPLSLVELHQLVFTDSAWSRRFNQILKNTDYHSTPWTADKGGVLSRTCTYTMALNQAMAPKSCIVNEKLELRHNVENEYFVIEKETQNGGIPYSDNFTVQCTYCATRVNKTTSRLRVHGGINYKKSIWGVVKTYLEKGTFQGLDQHFLTLEQTLNDECNQRAVNNDFENESVSSSIEDPITTTVIENLAATDTSSTPRIEERTTAGQSLSSTSQASMIQPDYSPYIRIIISLLAGLCLLNLLLLIYISQLPSHHGHHPTTVDSVKESPIHSDDMLSNLLLTVNRLAREIEQLKTQRRNEL